MTGQNTTNLVGSPVLSSPELPKESTEREGEFERFRSLAAKIVKVPKTELDDKREKS